MIFAPLTPQVAFRKQDCSPAIGTADEVKNTRDVMRPG